MQDKFLIFSTNTLVVSVRFTDEETGIICSTVANKTPRFDNQPLVFYLTVLSTKKLPEI